MNNWTLKQSCCLVLKWGVCGVHSEKEGKSHVKKLVPSEPHRGQVLPGATVARCPCHHTGTGSGGGLTNTPGKVVPGPVPPPRTPAAPT